MAGTLGTITGQVRIDVSQAVAAYAALRAANIATLLALRSASTVFIAAGAAMGAAGFAIGAGFLYAVKSAAEFERQLDFFGAVSNSTAAEMEAVRAKALQLGQQTIFSSKQVADAFVELGKAGVSAKQIIEGVGVAVTSLGAAGDIPLAQAANIITAAIQTFKLGAKDAVHVADLLAGAANASIVDIQDLGVSLKYVGGVAASISLPIEDVVDALSLLGKAGIRGSTAGTSLRQILVSLTGTSKKANGVLKDLGIITKDGANQFFTAQGKAKPLAEIFQVLQDHTEGLTEAQRLSAFKIIFNNRALAAANILSREGAKGFAAMNKEISKTTAADVAGKRLDNLSGDVERLQSALETLFINAGTPFQEFLRNIVQLLTRWATAFTQLSPSTQNAIFVTIAITGAILSLMAVLSTTIGLIFRFASNLLLLRGAIVVVLRVLTALRVGLIATWLAALGPIGLVIAAVLLLAAAFVIAWKKSETFRNIVKSVGETIVTAFWAVVNFFRGPFVSAMVTAWNAVQTAFTTAKNAIVAAWNSVVAFFITIATAIKNGVVNTFNAVVGFFAALPGRILSFVSALVTGVIAFFSTLPERIAFIIGFMIGRAIQLMIRWNNLMIGIVLTIVRSVVSFFQQLPGRLQAIWLAIVAAGVRFGISLKNTLVNAAKAAYNGVVNFFRLLPGRLLAIWNAVRSAAVSAWNSLKNAVVNAAKAVYNGIIAALRAIPGILRSYWTTTVNNARNSWNTLKNTVVGIAKSIPGAIKSALSGLAGIIKDVFWGAINAVSSLGGAAYDKAKSIGSSLWNGFKSGLGIHSPSFIEKAMFAIHDTMVDEIGFLGGMVRKAQLIAGDLPAVSRTVTGVEAARAASIAGTTGSTRPGTVEVPTSNGPVALDEETIAAIVEALSNVELPVYLDSKRVDAAMTSTAVAGGYTNRRDY